MDRVQVMKRESADLGGSAADDSAYPLPIRPQQDAIEVAGVYVQSATERDELVYLKRDSSGNLLLKDKVTSETTLAALVAGGGGSGGGLTTSAHEALNSLVHDLARTCYVELTRTSGKVSGVIAWTNSGKTQKVREVAITRAAGLVSQVARLQYDAAGTLAKTVTSTITRSGGAVASIANVET